MLDVNKAVLVGDVSNIHFKDDALVHAVYFKVTTCVFSPDGKGHSNTHNVVAFGKNAERMRMLEDGMRVYVDGRLEVKEGRDGLPMVQVVVISFILDIYEFEQSGVDREVDEGSRVEDVAVGDIRV